MDNNEHSDFLLVPQDRIGALIGKNGATKAEIEEKTHTKLVVDSKEGEIEVIQKGTSIDFLKATRIIKSIGRGFSPEKAFRLFEDDILLEIIEVRDVVGKNKGAIKAKKGRVIGSEGKAREELEEETGAKISVYGKTIAIIGTEEETQKATKAIEMLLGGASHEMAYDYLKKDFEKGKFEL